ncbi:MAG: pantetheine-phosphate adenylyltransferase [bacterium]|nr:pantetheine-phosphate adenylyltransferase [bacterium]
MKRIAVYPGSFDPVTYGHLDIVKRSLELFDQVIIAVLSNTMKKSLFTADERYDMLMKVTSVLPNVQVDIFSGLLVDYIKNKSAIAIIKGLRAISDFEHEFQMALMNKKLNPKIETLFMMTNEKYLYLSSSMVKEIVELKGNVLDFVPSYVSKKLKEKLNLN